MAGLHQGLFAEKGFAAIFGVGTLVLLSIAASAQASQSTTTDAAGSRLAPLVISGETIIGGDGYAVDLSRSATKTDTPLLATPQTIDVVTRQQIEDQGARSVSDALKYTPGVFTGLAGASSRQTAVSIRGFPGGDVNNTFMDGLRLLNDPGSYSNFLIDPFFLQRIDVVKGPASVLYGRTMPGGLVNMVTKKPLNKRQGLIRLYGGSYSTYGAGVDFTGPLPDADWGSYRLTASFESSDTQFDVVERERYTVMPQVRLNLTPDTTLLLQAYLQHEPEGGFHGSVPYAISVDGSRFGGTVDSSWVDGASGNAQFERDEYLLSYKLTHEVNDAVSLTSKARYGHISTELLQVYQIGFRNGGPTLNRYATRAEEDLQTFTIDNNVQIDFATGPVEHTVLLGLGYQQRDNTVRYASGPAEPLHPFHPDYSGDAIPGTLAFAPANDRELRQIGVYIQDQMVWHRWHLLLSGRQDYLHREYVNGATGRHTERDDSAFSGRAALLYKTAWGLSPYVSYSEAFGPSAYTPAGKNIAAPVASHQYEIGLKYQPEGMDALFTLALYDLTQENVRQRTAVRPPNFISVGDVQSRGVEASVQADLTKRLHVAAAYSYSDVEYQDNITRKGVTIQAGNRPVRIPEQQASLWLAYDFSDGVRGGVGARYVSESYANAANTLKVPAYTLVDAFVRFDLGAFSPSFEGASLQINASNIFDKEYVAACFSELNCYYGQARTITATLDYRF